MIKLDQEPLTPRDQAALTIFPTVLAELQGFAAEQCKKPGRGSMEQIIADITYTFADALMARRSK